MAVKRKRRLIRVRQRFGARNAVPGIEGDDLGVRSARVGPGMKMRLNKKTLDRDGEHAKEACPSPASGDAERRVHPAHHDDPTCEAHSAPIPTPYDTRLDLLPSAAGIFKTERAVGATRNSRNARTDRRNIKIALVSGRLLAIRGWPEPYPTIS